MADNLLDTLKDSGIDADALSSFMIDAAGVKVPRRLAPAIDTLEFYLEYLRGLQAVYEQESGLVDVNGVQVKPVKQALTDALDAAVVGGGGLADTAVATVPQAVGHIARPQSSKNTQTLDVSEFVDFNAADHTTGLLKAVAAAKLLNKGLVCRDTRKLIISALVDMSLIRNIHFNNDILCLGATAKIKIGGLSNSSLPTNINFQSITNGTSSITTPPPPTPLFDICGLKGGRITVGHCNYMRIYSDSANVNTSSNAYSDYILTGAVTKLELTDSGAPVSWVNENRFHGGRLSILHIKSVGYKHNHNKFYNPTVEGDLVDFRFEGAVDNTIFGIRAEATSNSLGVTFDASSANNKLILSWANSADPRGMYQNPMPIIDNGMANTVIHEATYMYDKYSITTADANTVLIANATDSASNNTAVNPNGGDLFPVKAKMTPSLKGFQSPINRLILSTDLIKVRYGDVLLFDCDYDGSLLRPYYTVYDSNMKLIDDGGLHMLQVSLSWNPTNKYYGFGSYLTANFLNGQPAQVNSKDVAYIKISAYGSDSNFYRKISLSLMTKRTHGSDKRTQIEQKYKPLVLAGKPTQGFLSKDSIVFDSAASVNRVVTFAHRTQATTSIAATSTSATVDAISTVTDGDIYGILLPSGKTAWGLVSGLTASSFTIAATGEAVAAGTLIVFNRWSEPTTTP